MTLRKTNIKQHYVPQFYLRNFANENEKLYAFDCNRGNNYQTSPKKECYEKLLYDINPKILNKFSDNPEHYDEIVDDKIRTLNEQVSSILFNFLNRAIKTETDFKFDRPEREKLYDFIIIQIFRTPFYRERLGYLCVSFALKTGINDLNDKEFLDVIHNLLLYGVIEQLYGLDFKLNKTYHLFFDHLIDEIFNIKIQLRNAGKLFLLNNSKEHFITSNTPINVRWKPDFLAHHKALITFPGEDKPVVDFGNYIEFLTIHLPISSDFAIFIFEKELDENLTEMNRGIGIIRDWNSDLVTNLNYSTFLRSLDKVFSKNNDFEKYVELKEKRQNPALNFRFGE
jgi:hypothetical protein